MSRSRSTMAAKNQQAVALVGEVEDKKADLDGLTEKQAEFVRALTSGPTAGNPAASCVVAGYSEKTAPQIAAALMKHPRVIAAIDATIREEISTVMTIEAVKVARRIINDEDAPLKLRGIISAKVIEWSGVVQRVQQEKAKETGLDGTKRLTEMSRDELEATVRNGAAILQAAANLPPAGGLIEGQLAQDTAQTGQQD